MSYMSQNFVTFFSPGSLVAETTTLAIDSWDSDEALAMSTTIVERHNQTPYAFQFSRRERGPDDLDSHVAGKSGMFFIGGRVQTLEVVAKEQPDSILHRNMVCNDWDRAVSSPGWSQPLEKGDVVL